MAFQVLLLSLILLSQEVICKENNYRKEGFMNNLNNGMKFAQEILASESVALKVAEFVVRAFQTAKNPSLMNERHTPSAGHQNEKNHDGIIKEDNNYNSEINEEVNPMTPMRHLVKLFGLQPNQISAVAINALIFVAQMISTFLTGPKRSSKPTRSDDLNDWIINKNSRKLQELILSAKNESLPEAIEDMIKQQGSEQETSCIQLLVCKITPFVNKMQYVVFGKEDQIRNNKKNVRGSEILYRHLPTVEEINERSDICEKKHRDCDLNE